MKGLKKRIVSLLLSVAMMTTLVQGTGFTVQADESDGAVSEETVSIDDETEETAGVTDEPDTADEMPAAGETDGTSTTVTNGTVIVTARNEDAYVFLRNGTIYILPLKDTFDGTISPVSGSWSDYSELTVRNGSAYCSFSMDAEGNATGSFTAAKPSSSTAVTARGKAAGATSYTTIKCFTLLPYIFGTQGFEEAEDGTLVITLPEDGSEITDSINWNSWDSNVGYQPGSDLSLSIEPEGILSLTSSNSAAFFFQPVTVGTVDVTWSVSNENVAEDRGLSGNYPTSGTKRVTVKGVIVSDGDETGVTAVTEGTQTWLTAYDGTENSSFSWTSSNEDVAMVSQSGKVVALKEGYTLIQAANADGTKGGIGVYVHESGKPYLESLTISDSNFKLRAQDEDGNWLNSSASGSFSFDRTVFEYGFYVAYSSQGRQFSPSAEYYTENYILTALLDGEETELPVTLSSGDYTVTLRLTSKADSDVYTDYVFQVYHEYSDTVQLSTLSVVPADRSVSGLSFTLEEGADNTFYSEGNGYFLSKANVVQNTLVSGSYGMITGYVDRVLCAYLLEDVEEFRLDTSSVYTEQIVYSQGVAWETPESADELPEGWELYDPENAPVFVWKADEGQDYMTIYLHTVSEKAFRSTGWQTADVTNTLYGNQSNRQLRIYRLDVGDADVAVEDISLDKGSFMTPAFTEGSSSASAVIPADAETVAVTLTVSGGGEVSRADTTLTQKGASYTDTVSITEDTTTLSYTVTAEKESDAYTGTLKKSVSVQLSRAGDLEGLPDAVVDYIAPASQYTNGRENGFSLGNKYGLYPERTLLGNGNWTNVTSLGNFGGYITWYYEDAITDDPTNPYGVEFRVFGNAYASGYGSEAGQVWVSEDGEEWYALAGSGHYEDSTVWNYQMTYENLNSKNSFQWSDNLGNSGTAINNNVGWEYPYAENYPLYDYGGDTESVTLSGILLKNFVGTTLPASGLGYYQSDMFGYVDALPSSNAYSGDGTGEGDLSTSTTENPYADTGYGSSFDLAWAVDAQGDPVSFEHGIHYIKVQSASHSYTSDVMGEVSTEVSTCVRVSSAGEEVGVTDGVTEVVIASGDESMTVDAGDFTRVSDTIYTAAVDVGEMRNLLFTVEAGADDNLYVNSQRVASGEQTETAYTVDQGTERMVRIIVQSGEQEPVSYFLSLTGTASVAEEVLAVEALIQEIGVVSKESKDAIEAARAAYDALSSEHQEAVENYDVLLSAEQAYQELTEGSLGTSEEKIEVVVTVEKFVLGQGYVQEPVLVSIPEDTNITQLTTVLLGADNVNFSSGGSYLSAIADQETELDIPQEILDKLGDVYHGDREDEDWLAEFDYSSQSGWMYCVNESFPGIPAVDHNLQAGDYVSWRFTLYGLGADIGQDNSEYEGAAEMLETADKQDLTRLVAYVNALEEYEAFAESHEEEYQAAMAALTAWDSTQEAVNAALAALQAAFDEAQSSGEYGEVKALALSVGEDSEDTPGTDDEDPDSDETDVEFLTIFQNTQAYLIDTVTEPEVGTEGGEWAVLGLARSEAAVSAQYYGDYYEKVVQYVEENISSGRLNKNKSSENSRIILALTSIGKDPTDVGGYDLLTALADFDYIKKQGINGPIWALLALDSGDYEIPQDFGAETQTTREGIISYLLEEQNDEDGWAYTGTSADTDITAMVVQALAPYYESDDRVKEALDRAILCLSQLQNSETGGYATVGQETSESCAQVIVALSALGIDADGDERFISNGVSVLDALLAYYQTGSGFAHVSGGNVNQMATEQAYYAMTAYARMKNGDTSLYDMSDVTGDRTVTEKTLIGGKVTLSTTEYVYNGEEKKPKASVWDADGVKLSENTDYVLSYENNVNAGSARAVIQGLGLYGGELEASYTIQKAGMEGLTATLSQTEYTYSGEQNRPGVTVNNAAGEALTANTDYTTAYADHVNAGNGTVTITGKGNYQGSLKIGFVITTASLTDRQAELSASSYVYDGNAKEPDVTVEDLKEGTDFTVSYKDNVEAGTGKAIVSGMNNYSGTLSLKFAIVKQSVSESADNGSTQNGGSTTTGTVTGTTTSRTTDTDAEEDEEDTYIVLEDSNGTSMSVEGLKSILGEDSEFYGEILTAGETYGRASEQMELLGDVLDYQVLELSLLDDDGEEMHQLDGYVAVRIPIPDGFALEGNVVVYRLEDDDRMTECETEVEASDLVFKTDHFSTYIIAERETAAAETEEEGVSAGSALGLDTIAAAAETAVWPYMLIAALAALAVVCVISMLKGKREKTG